MKNSLEANDLIIKTQVHVSWELIGVLSVQYKHRFEICSHGIGRRKGGGGVQPNWINFNVHMKNQCTEVLMSLHNQILRADVVKAAVSQWGKTRERGLFWFFFFAKVDVIH